MTTPIRIKITSKTCETNVSYLVIKGGRVTLLSASAKRLPISQLGDNLVETLFKLEDAKTANDAIKALNGSVKGKTFSVL